MRSDINSSFFRFVAYTAIIMIAVAAQSALADGILDTVNAGVAAATSGWMSKALELAKTLFLGLAAIEFAWSAIQLTLKKSELTDIAVSTMFKVMNLAFFSMILIKAPEWIPAIMDSFKQAGGQVSGAAILTPSQVISRGIDLAGDLVTKGQDLNGQQNGILSSGNYMLSAVIIGLSGLLVILGFAAVALQLFIALLESYIIIGGGALMLGFLGSRWTSNFGEKYFSYAVSVGVKLFSMYLLIGMGDTFFNAMTQNLDQIVASGKEIAFGDWLGMGGASVVYGGLGYMVPATASSMLNGATSLSMSNLGAAAGAVAAAPVSAGLAAAATGAAVGSYGAGLASLLKTKSAAGGIGGSPNGGSGGGGIGGGLKPGGGGSMGSGAAQPAKAGNASGVQPAGSTSAGAAGFSSSPGGGADARNMTGGGSAKGGAGGATLSSKLSDKARDLQYQADKRAPGLVQDGNHGGGVSIRLGHHED
jgi:type IV secretion system protein TrbL